MNNEMDYLMGRVWESAQMNGYNLSNTLIMFTSDHGEMNIEHIGKYGKIVCLKVRQEYL